MGTELVPLGIAENVSLPKTIVLHSRVSNALGIPRRLLIAEPDQLVPESVRDWLLNDSRYQHMIALPDAEAVAFVGEENDELITDQAADLGLGEPEPDFEDQDEGEQGEGDSENKSETGDQEEGEPETDPENETGENDSTPEPNTGDTGETGTDGESGEPEPGGESETGDQEEDEPDLSGAWLESWNVPTLRDYAAVHNVELKSADKRDDVIAKIKAAGLPQGKE